ncbi:hypothetical protein WA158_000859 [Blastocystis sp. Blastoise]
MKFIAKDNMGRSTFIDFEFEPDDYVDALLATLEVQFESVNTETVLSYNGKDMKLGQKLANYNLVDGAVISFSMNNTEDNRLFIIYEQQEPTFVPYNPSLSVKYIIDTWKHNTNIENFDLRAVFDGMPINEPEKTLQELHIPPGGILRLIQKLVRYCQLVILCPGNERLDIPFDPQETIAKLKKKIEIQTKIPTNEQVISINGVPVKHDMDTLDLHGIHGHSLINVERVIE